MKINSSKFKKCELTVSLTPKKEKKNKSSASIKNKSITSKSDMHFISGYAKHPQPLVVNCKS